MKSVKFFFAIAVLCMAGMTGTVEAQERRNEDWKQKFMSEKIAFLTSEMQITPEEAQVFWPVYNQIWKEKDEVMKKIFKSFRELEEALDSGKSGKEINKLICLSGKTTDSVFRRKRCNRKQYSAFSFHFTIPLLFFFLYKFAVPSVSKSQTAQQLCI